MPIEDLSDEGAVTSSGVIAPKRYEEFYERTTLGEEFTDDDLASPAFRKILMDQMRRLASENRELRHYREQFHQRDKKVEALEARTEPASDFTMLSSVAFAVGGLVAGAGISQILEKTLYLGFMMLGLGLLLMVAPLLVGKRK